MSHEKGQVLSEQQQQPRKKSKTTGDKPTNHHHHNMNITSKISSSSHNNNENMAPTNVSGGENILLKNILNLLEANNNKDKSEKTTKHHKNELKRAREETVFWKNQFETLKDLRETQPELQLKEFQESVVKKEESMNGIISSIKQNISNQFSDEGAHSSSKFENDEFTSNDMQEQMEQLERKLETKLGILRAYEKLTGFVLKPVVTEEDNEEETPTTYQCTAINHVHKRVTKFSVTFPSEATNDEEEEEKLATFTADANRHFLPASLREKAKVEVDQLPMLAQRVLKAFYSTTTPP
jgi:hypothetical protein